MADRKSGFAVFLALSVALIAAAFLFSTPAPDPDAVDETTLTAAREATGGAQTRESIMARQRGETVDLDFRREDVGDPNRAKAATDQLGTLGGVSDAEMFRALRYNTADITTSARNPAADVIIQDGGMWWLQLREDVLGKYGGWLLMGMIALFIVVYALFGRVPIAGEKTGRTMLRFGGFDRWMHWTTAGSFILLGLTGLVSMYGRQFLIPVMGLEAHATLALWSKLIHNNVCWAFMIGVVLIFFKWVAYNIPNWNDVKWMLVLGGLFNHDIHPPAGKFNAGQKLIFWSVMFLSVCVVATGLSLLMPFRAPVFEGLFGWINSLGMLPLVGLADLPAALSPQQEMQYTQLAHAVFAFLFMAMIIGHIYIGTLGMEGAFDAMGSGYVEEQWAKEHHSIWYDEMKAKEAEAPNGTAAAPAE
ncbi:formate dehydrogenase gamma subunit [Aliiruegeria haliotis]|uniref:Formate dehydrogenase gamma subunit n=1 Tax=Aliiruegeria haliotis TaxID=1280846 RepID=A0A2T0RPG0_9RHOB|nr:formate dehydrogenase subunit gamma [Aliiruegeria haliotis]PRY23076.1 formate dehydrogenase gamma subunit [Aliiruegeria haliotis]